MIRRVLLVVMAIIVSHSLVALSSYCIYAVLAGVSEALLSLIIRFIFSPVIAFLTGALVGLLSKDHPVPVAVLGLAPWIFNLFSPERPKWAALGHDVIYVVLGALAAQLVFQFRQRDGLAKLANVSPTTR
jgi:hypothetical protein